MSNINENIRNAHNHIMSAIKDNYVMARMYFADNDIIKGRHFLDKAAELESVFLTFKRLDTLRLDKKFITKIPM